MRSFKQVIKTFLDSRQTQHATGLALLDSNDACELSWKNTDEKTSFHLASVTKSLTAAALLRACQQGKLNLDEKPDGLDLSLRDLLSHQTGLAPHDLLWACSFKKLKFSDIFSELYRLREPGSHRFVYNNFAYTYLGRLLEKTYQCDISEILQNEFWRPQELSSFSFDTNLDLIAPAGGLCSDLSDAAKWTQYLLKALTNPAYELHELFKVQVEIKDSLGLVMHGLDWLTGPLFYAFGMFRSVYNGEEVYFHPGIIEGHTSLIFLIPSQKVAGVVLEKENLSTDSGAFFRQVCEEFIGIKSINGSFDHHLYGPLSFISDSELEILGQHCSYERHTEEEFSFSLRALNLELSFKGQLVFQNGRLEKVLIPLSMDAKSPAVEFKRQEA